MKLWMRRTATGIGALLVGATLWGHAPSVMASDSPLRNYVIDTYGHPPAIPTGALSSDLAAAVQLVFVDSLERSSWGPVQSEALEMIGQSGDPRLAWVIADMMRFTWRQSFDDALADAASKLLQIELKTVSRWSEITDHLIAWDVPGYLATKRSIFTQFVPGWDRIFVEGDMDWRLVSWGGGVLIDDRPYDTTDTPCNCTPAADNPEVSTAAGATWLQDDDIVFGIAINGEARAYPRRIMEVREMINDTLGGRDLAIPYCTLCASAQAYFTDNLAPGVTRPIMRTSGLLIRSNKVMYDIETYSVFDTFLGTAVAGPLADQGVQLDQATVITSDWGSWKQSYPDTTVLVEALALGRDFDFRNGRDSDGPIFPIGDVDPRLPVHEDIVGAVTTSGRPVAFQRGAAMAALQRGRDVRFEDVHLSLDAGGIKATNAAGDDIGSHQAFWFAWSQFHPTTALWTGE